jgi:dTDP-4-dehydrorhamnose reductase
MRILLIGKNGQVGTAIWPLLSGLGEAAAVGRDQCDLSRPDSIRSTIRAWQPDVIVNAAAYTNVNQAESDRDGAFAINAQAPAVLAEEALRLAAVLVHYSTDYVFDGTKPDAYVEDDPVSPLNVYGASKLEGEQRIQAIGGNYFIFRTSWVYGPSGSNFVRTILRLAQEREELTIVSDQVGAPTSSLQIAEATLQVLTALPSLPQGGSALRGVYHLTAAGETSWHGFAEEILDQARKWVPGKLAKVLPVPSSAYPTPAKRPLNSRLSNDRLSEAFGVRLADWHAGLSEVLKVLEASATAAPRTEG